jgi:hypothetical protein
MFGIGQTRSRISRSTGTSPASDQRRLSRLKAVDSRNSIQTYDFRPKVYFLAKTDVFILFGPSSNYFQGCKSFHRLQTHSILTVVVTGIECFHRTGPLLSTNRDLPAGRFAEPGDNRGEPAGGPAGLLSLSFLLPTPMMR